MVGIEDPKIERWENLQADCYKIDEKVLSINKIMMF